MAKKTSGHMTKILLNLGIIKTYHPNKWHFFPKQKGFVFSSHSDASHYLKELLKWQFFVGYNFRKDLSGLEIWQCKAQTTTASFIAKLCFITSYAEDHGGRLLEREHLSFTAPNASVGVSSLKLIACAEKY